MIKSDQRKSGRALVALAVAAGLGILGALSAMTGPRTPAAEPAAAPADNHYIGAAKCKNCHKTEHSGDQWTAWERGPHSKAWDVLASEEAKKIATEKGLGDPQKAGQCVKCHVTAHGKDDQIKKGFKVEMGVQCESCHGPGEVHMKARMKAAMSGEKPDPAVPATLGEGEIISSPEKELCLSCHNTESPTFDRFCYWAASAKIRHWDPRKEHADARVCTAENPDECKGCEGKPMEK